MSYLPSQLPNRESLVNKTTTPLNNGQTYTGTWEYCAPYSSVVFYTQTDTVVTMLLDFSPDGINVDSTLSFTNVANINEVHRITVTRPYYRLRIINNSGVNQSFLRAGVLLGEHSHLTLGLNVNNIQSDWDSLVTRAINIGQDPLGSYVNARVGGDAATTDTPLSASATWTSSLLDVRGYSQIETRIFSDVEGTLIGRWYADSDKQTLIRTFTRPYANGEIGNLSYLSSPTFGDYLEYSYVNGSTNQTAFNLELYFRTNAISGQILGVNDFIPAGVVANLGRNIIVGQDGAGNFKNVPVDSQGNINTHISSPLTMFGTLAIDEMTPITQIRFPYNINPDIVVTSSTAGASVFQSQSMAWISAGTGSGQSASLASVTRAVYRPGQGIAVRFAGYFLTGSANDILWAGVGDEEDGFFYYVTGSVFGIATRRSGETTFIPQSEWNIDKLDGSRNLTNPSGQLLSPTYGSPFQIRYQWLGFGAQLFSIEDETSGEFVPVHLVQYSNKNRLPSVFNPSLPFYAGTIKGDIGTEEPKVVLASIGLFNEGVIKITGPTNMYRRGQVASANGDVHYFTIRNKATINDVTNRSRIVLTLASILTDGNNSVDFRFIQNATVTGATYNDISSNSIVEVTTAGTYSPNTGRQIFAIAGGRIDSKVVDLKSYEFELQPNSTITVLLTASGANANCQATLVWVEDL